LGIGEAYYFGAARHLSLSYFDQPPAAAFLAGLSLRVAGTVDGLVLRAPFILLFAGTTWLMFLIGRRLFGPWQGFWAAVLLNLAPVFTLSTGIFLQPEGPLVFFWLAALYCMAPLLVGTGMVRHANRQWIAAGSMLGVAVIGKYSALFLVLGAGLYLLASGDRRRWLRQPGPYLAAGAASLCFVPVLVWNANHQWISFVWQGSRGANYRGVHFDWLIHNLSGQVLELLPWIWLPLICEPFRAIRGTAADLSARRLLVCVGLPPIVAFTAVSAYAPIGDHFHWGTPGYLTLLIGLGATVHRWLSRGSVVAKFAVGAAVAASVGFMFLVNVQAVTGRFTTGSGAVSHWLAAGNDATIELIDYTQLATAFRGWGLLDRKDVFVFSDRWYLGGKVDYALKGRLPFLLFNSTDPREYAFFDSPNRWVGKEGILVSRRDDAEHEIERDFGAFCPTLEPMGAVPIRRRERVKLTLYVYRCASLVRPYPMPYG
jgi:4-amino-4-deoxy-L-arabinose transferase-like glycosyltransferase